MMFPLWQQTLAALAFFASVSSSSPTRETRHNTLATEALASRANGWSYTYFLSPVYWGSEKKTITQYTAKLPIGEHFPDLILDTGSALTWMLSSNVNPIEWFGHNFYPVPQKIKCRPNEIPYGTDASGVKVESTPVTDESYIADLDIEEFDFEAALDVKNAPGLWKVQEVDGVFGMGRGPKGWIEQVKTDHPGQMEQFAVDLGAAKPILVLGDYSGEIQMSGKVTWSSVVPGTIMWIVGSGKGNLLIDTGAATLVLEASWAKEFYDALDGDVREDMENGKTVRLLKCGANVPDLKLQISGDPFKVPGSRLIGPPTDKTKTWCYSLVDYMPPNYQFSLIGVPFLEQYVTIFDLKENRVGFSSR